MKFLKAEFTNNRNLFNDSSHKEQSSITSDKDFILSLKVLQKEVAGSTKRCKSEIQQCILYILHSAR